MVTMLWFLMTVLATGTIVDFFYTLIFWLFLNNHVHTPQKGSHWAHLAIGAMRYFVTLGIMGADAAIAITTIHVLTQIPIPF